MSDPYEVRPFGRDCMGNCTGYRVQRYVWVRSERSMRRDGCALELEIAGQFFANIYEQGSHDQAWRRADALCDQLNNCNALVV